MRSIGFNLIIHTDFNHTQLDNSNLSGLSPPSARLIVAALESSHMHRDDLAQLEAGMGLFDAFYRWARDVHEEGHDWPSANIDQDKPGK